MDKIIVSFRDDTSTEMEVKADEVLASAAQDSITKYVMNSLSVNRTYEDGESLELELKPWFNSFDQKSIAKVQFMHGEIEAFKVEGNVVASWNLSLVPSVVENLYFTQA